MTSAVSIWFSALRPKTLPLAISAIILGSSLAAYDGFFEGTIFSLALITAILLQVISNLANDYGDAETGADNEKRVGPVRVMQAGLVSKNEMKRALLISVSATSVFGVTLVYTAFKDDVIWALIFILLGISAIVAAIKYTIGKSPYGYKGYGDISVFIFFGLVGVIGTYTLFSHDPSLLLILPASICGLLSASVLNINNIRDLSSDIQVGKFTLAAKLGYKKAIIYHWILLILTEVSAIAFIILAQLPALTWLHLILVPLFIYIAKQLPNYGNGPLMNNQLGNTTLGTFAYCSLIAIGMIA